MAKFIGKIFKFDNKTLKIRNDGSHYVHVKGFNPFTRKYYCRVITSLEHKVTVGKSDRKLMKKIPSYHISGNDYYVMTRQKYKQMRQGKITPIPMSKTVGFSKWSGYSEKRYLHYKHFRGKKPKNMYIKRKKAH